MKTQREFFGFGSIENLCSIVNKYKSIFLVTGKTSYQSSGAERVLKRILQGHHVGQFSDFQTNPLMDDISKGIRFFRNKEYDIVVAVGGGSVMDVAKLINSLSAQEGNTADYVRGERKIISPGLPLVAIPTTAGTGSEATHFAVVYIGNRKYSLAHESIIPNYSIVDPQFTMNLPPYVTACSGMDAFSQAMESFWSIQSTKESRAYAEEAIHLSLENLAQNVNSPTPDSRFAMLKAANLSGKAINISKTTAPHAISYTITSKFGVPHGHAVALTLGEVLKYNALSGESRCSDSRGAIYTRDTMNSLLALLGVENPDSANEKIKKLLDNIGLETHLSKLGISPLEDLPKIVSGVNLERLQNNPYQLHKEDLYSILQGAV